VRFVASILGGAGGVNLDATIAVTLFYIQGKGFQRGLSSSA